MSDAALTLLRIGLLGLLYVFFAWVLWSAVSQLRKPAVAPDLSTRSPTKAAPVARNKPTAPTGQITIIEPADLAGSTMSIGDELTVGRAAKCTLTLDDTFISSVHARVVWRDRTFVVEDAGSTNGTFLNQERLLAPTVLRLGDRIQIGSTVLEFT